MSSPRGRGNTNSANYRVIDDPAGLFTSGTFPKLDFLCSLGGKIWAEGMTVRNPDGRIMVVSYPWIEGNQVKLLTDKENGARWILVQQRTLKLLEPA